MSPRSFLELCCLAVGVALLVVALVFPPHRDVVREVPARFCPSPTEWHELPGVGNASPVPLEP